MKFHIDGRMKYITTHINEYFEINENEQLYDKHNGNKFDSTS